MPIDFAPYLGAVTRSVSVLDYAGKPARAVTLARSYDTSVDDLWDALTNAERLPRWFAPVTGDLKLGGRYQVQGNAGGTIETCDAPHLLFLTWQFGPETSWVEARLEADGDDRSHLTLTHIAPVNDHWTTYGPGAVGVGWDLGLLGLALYIERPDAAKVDEAEFSASAEGKAFVAGSSEDWGQASIAAGTDRDEAIKAAKATTAFYTGATPEEN
ncbi:uncharacterized protein YndB with AHSA1/START domain [Sphingomonas sp. UYAg733]